MADTTASINPPPTGIDKETWRTYYVLQYERVAQHENSRLHVTNTILAASVIALGLTTAFGEGIKWIAVAPFAVALINFFAIQYVWHTRKWVTIHQTRGRKVLERLDPELLELQKKVDGDQNHGAEAKEAKADRNARIWGGRLLEATHLVVLCLSVLLGIAWFLS